LWKREKDQKNNLLTIERLPNKFKNNIPRRKTVSQLRRTVEGVWGGGKTGIHRGSGAGVPKKSVCQPSGNWEDS